MAVRAISQDSVLLKAVSCEKYTNWLVFLSIYRSSKRLHSATMRPFLLFAAEQKSGAIQVRLFLAIALKVDETSFLDNEPVQEAVIRHFEIIDAVSRSTSRYNNQLLYYFQLFILYTVLRPFHDCHSATAPRFSLHWIGQTDQIYLGMVLYYLFFALFSKNRC